MIDEAVAPTVDSTGLTQGSHCAECGEILVPQEVVPMLRRGTFLERDEDGMYRVYTDGVFNPGYNGLIDYEGESFFVAAGVMQQGANGLALYDGQWYFLAAGRVVKEHSGFALYDGEWFLIWDGLLSTNANGIFEYDGGRFLIAAGRKVAEYSGLWQNSA